MTFLDLFAGIGGFRLALERAGHTCVGFCEIDKFARQTYKANFNTEGEVEWHDITAVTDEDVRQLGSVDIITGGFPCQSFSVAGKRGGFNDTRGTLFFEIARIARILKPRYLLLENVKGLLNHAGGDTFFTILNTLAELGYWWEYQVLNSKDFGVPQNRERVFIVGHLGGEPRRKVFPITGTNGQAIKQVSTMQGGGLEPKILTPKRTEYGKTIRKDYEGGKITESRHNMTRLEPREDGISNTITTVQKDNLLAIPVLTPDRAEKRQNGRRFKEPGEPMFTLTSQDRHGVMKIKKVGNIYPSGGQGGHLYETNGIAPCVTGHRTNSQGWIREPNGYEIRRLTPLECFRLQGFPDSHHDKAKAAGVSDSQLYKQAGNAVTVTVVYEIAKRLG